MDQEMVSSLNVVEEVLLSDKGTEALGLAAWPDRTAWDHERKRKVVSTFYLIAGHQRLTLEI